MTGRIVMVLALACLLAAAAPTEPGDWTLVLAGLLGVVSMASRRMS
jgi:hypothetical protein